MCIGDEKRCMHFQVAGRTRATALARRVGVGLDAMVLVVGGRLNGRLTQPWPWLRALSLAPRRLINVAPC
jgi:hypothetical protein